MILCEVETVIFDEISQMGIVLLSEKNSNRAVPIWVGIFEAQAILFRLQNSYFPRPLTHDLLKSCIEQLSGKVDYIFINKIEHGTYFCEIHIRQNNKKIIVDSRPSDAIALALRVDAPIYVNEHVFESNRVDKEEFFKEQKEKLYKAYLETLEEDKGKLKH